MIEFIERYFIEPIMVPGHYNIINTSVFALWFVAMALLTIKLFQHFKIRIDRRFFFAIFPFILLGSVSRSLEDAHVLTGYWFVTPIIYILIYSLVLAVLGFSLAIESRFKKNYWFVMGTIGFAILAYAISFLRILYFQPMLFVMMFTSVFALIIFGIRKLLKPKFLTEINAGIIIVHLFDASTTFTAIELSRYWNPSIEFIEQHVLAGSLMGLFGNYSVFIMKIIAIPVALWILDRYVDDRQSNLFLKLAVFILGFGPGLRNMLSAMILGG